MKVIEFGTEYSSTARTTTKVVFKDLKCGDILLLTVLLFMTFFRFLGN